MGLDPTALDIHLGHTGFVWLLKLIQQAGLCSSTSEAKRLIQQGAVKVDGERFADTEQKLRPQSGMVIKAGKRKFLRIK